MWLAFAVSLAASQFVVLAPAALRNSFTGSIPFVLANFGHIPYGRKMTGQLLLASPLANCEVEAPILNNQTKDDKFVLMERGNCSFVSQALSTQGEHGSLAVIFDDREEDTASVALVDDGHGYLVKIPCLIISSAAGSQIAKFMQDNPDQQVTISVHFDTHYADTLHLSLFLSNSDRHSAVFLREFQPLYKTIERQSLLSVYFETFACAGCRVEDCVQGRMYCASPPLIQGETGRLVILQMLRQHFVFQRHRQHWFQYMDRFDMNCNSYASAADCSDEQLASLGIKDPQINLLAEQELDKEDGVLRASRLAKLKAGVNLVPDVVVNNVTYHGELQAIDVYELACNSLNQPPKECNPFVNDPEKLTPQLDHRKSLILISVGVLGVLLLLSLCIFCVYRRILRRRLTHELGGQVNTLVSQYIQLYEQKK